MQTELEKQSIKFRREVELMQQIAVDIQSKTESLGEFLSMKDRHKVVLKILPKRHQLRIVITKKDLADGNYMIMVNNLIIKHKYRTVTFGDTGLVITTEMRLNTA